MKITKTTNYIVCQGTDRVLWVKCRMTGLFTKHAPALEELQKEAEHKDFIMTVIALGIVALSIITGGLFLMGLPVQVSLLVGALIMALFGYTLVGYNFVNKTLKAESGVGMGVLVA